MNRTLWALLPVLCACSGGSEPEAPPAAAPATAAVPTTSKAIEAWRGDTTAAAGSSSTARDPGPRGGPAGAGDPLAGLGTLELAAFEVGKEDFSEEELPDEGLGPTMNLDSCRGCHLQPAVGGSSPAINPQIAFAAKASARNTVPPFLRQNGPIREARFVRNADGSPDGGVHALFTLAGRSDAAGCDARQRTSPRRWPAATSCSASRRRCSAPD